MSGPGKRRCRERRRPRFLPNAIWETPSLPVRWVRTDVLIDERHPLLPSPHRRATFDTVVALRVEGVSLSAIARVEGLAWNTVARWLDRAAAGCRRFSHGRVAGFVVEELQADEIRSFTGGKRRPPWIFAAMEGVVSPAAEVAHVSSQKF